MDISTGSDEQVGRKNPKYLDELLCELSRLHSVQQRHPERLCHASFLLSKEIEKVWTDLLNSADVHGTSQNMNEPSIEIESPDASTNLVAMHEKVMIPDLKKVKCNLVGRILGPGGMSLKKLEARTDCTILIRGEGSVKDRLRELRLIGTPGWEHLTEPLHVLIMAKDTNADRCTDKLRNCVTLISSLLTPDHDAYKKEQLIQLAIINGTYRPPNKGNNK